MEDLPKFDETSADDTKIKSDLFNLVEKLRIELQKKDEELAKEKQENQKLTARANRADELETEFVCAQEMIKANQLNLWISFPSNSCCYCITIEVSVQWPCTYLYVDASAQLCFDHPLYSTNPSQFKFIKNSNGTFSVYSQTKEKYLITNTRSSRVTFSANDEDSAGQFVLFFHPQNEHAGLMVDISTLAGSFLCMRDNYVMANSRIPPDDKFVIIPVDE